MPQHSRTAGQPLVGRGWTSSRGTRIVHVRDGRALTALRVMTYLLASLTCLVILAGAVYTAFVLHQVPLPGGGFARMAP